jgi:hypothetical protein
MKPRVRARPIGIVPAATWLRFKQIKSAKGTPRAHDRDPENNREHNELGDTHGQENNSADLENRSD